VNVSADRFLIKNFGADNETPNFSKNIGQLQDKKKDQLLDVKEIAGILYNILE